MTARRQTTLPRWPLALAGAALVWAGCSVEKDHELLGFFFDGVPLPSAPDADEAPGVTDVRRGATTVVVSGHDAYLERRCTECHGDRARFGFVTSGYAGLSDAVCVGCHEDSIDLPRKHGPVALGACLICHEPHVSRYPALLIDDAQTLCLKCHDEELEGAPATSPHADLARACLECHAAHGGSDAYFLRPDAPRSGAAPVDPAEPEGEPEREREPEEGRL